MPPAGNRWARASLLFVAEGAAATIAAGLATVPIQAVTFRLEATGSVRAARLEKHAPAITKAELAVIGRRDVWMPEAGGRVETPVYDREKLGGGHSINGPAIIEQMDTTTVVPRRRNQSSST